MARIKMDVAGMEFTGELLEDEAPESIAAMEEFLPLESELMHVRWSGHAVWINIEEIELPKNIPRENHTVYPSRGDVLFYPGYRNEQEILIACGPTCFKSPAGELAGNHVAQLNTTDERLRALENRTLVDGVQNVTIQFTE